MSIFYTEKTLSVHHWTDSLFSFTTTRSPGFRFLSGQFTMLGLNIGTKPLLRAYSMVSPHYSDRLEFFSIKIDGGPLTSRLKDLKAGDEILVGSKTTGTLIIDNVLPGKRLYLLSTGTGLAPFLSLIRDPDIYERFDHIIMVHCCRFINDLAYDQLLSNDLRQDEYIGEYADKQLIYYPTVTREPFRNNGRIDEIIFSGRLFSDIAMPPINHNDDRFMLCGNPSMLKSIATILRGQNYIEGHHGVPGHFVIEKAFVDK